MKAYRMELYEASTNARPQGKLIGAVVVPVDVAGDEPLEVLRKIGRAMMHPRPLKGTIAVEEVEG
jgi:hypothetical protein